MLAGVARDSPGNKSVMQPTSPSPLTSGAIDDQKEAAGLPQEDVLHNLLLQPDENIDLDTDQFALFAKKASQQQ